ALRTRLSAPRIHVALALIFPVASVRRHVVADARSTRLDRALEHAPEGSGDRVALAPRRARGAARRAHSREEHRLVGVDVPDTRDDRLIEQQALDRNAPLARRGEQQRAVDLERVDAESRQARVRLTGREPEHLAELARVAEEHLGSAVLELETQMGVG